jgi:hypothetical protein
MESCAPAAWQALATTTAAAAIFFGDENMPSNLLY